MAEPESAAGTGSHGQQHGEADEEDEAAGRGVDFGVRHSYDELHAVGEYPAAGSIAHAAAFVFKGFVGGDSTGSLVQVGRDCFKIGRKFFPRHGDYIIGGVGEYSVTGFKKPGIQNLLADIGEIDIHAGDAEVQTIG